MSLVIASTTLQAQESDTIVSPWSKGGNTILRFGQSSYTNWAAGGNNSISLDAQLLSFADYKKEKHLWQNRIELAYGLNSSKLNGTQKMSDKIFLSSNYGYSFAKNLYLSAQLQFQTQFDEGYDYKTTPYTFVSTFMAPAYLNFGLGLTWTPTPWFTAILNPANLKETFVLNQELSDQGAFGVDKGEHLFTQFGAALNLEAKKELLKNIVLQSRLKLFSSYLEQPFQIVDVDWEVQLNMNINKWLSANLTTDLLYNYHTLYKESDGSFTAARVQFKELFGIGLQYKF